MTDAQAGDVLAAAFYSDPFMRYVQPNDSVRLRQLQWMFRRTVDYCRIHGGLVTLDEGAALGWLAPKQMFLNYLTVAQTGLIAMPFQMGWGAWRRLDKHEHFCESQFKNLGLTNHAYFWVLGVDPTLKGKGLGGALIRKAIAEQETAGRKVMLKTENPNNVGLYRHLGFETRFEGVAPSSGLKVWVMAKP